MSIEKKAHEAHDANRTLKEKYHIPYNCWIDWFTLGYRRAEKDIEKLIADDTQAAAFQTMGQYRSWLLEKLS